MMEDDEVWYHLTITLPRSQSYSVDDILHIIAAAKTPCGAACTQCDQLGIFDGLVSDRYSGMNSEVSDCAHTVEKRLSYYALFGKTTL